MIEVSKVNFTIMGDVPVTSKTLVKDIQDQGKNKSIESILLTTEDIHVFITLDFFKQDIKAYLDDLFINHIEDIQFYNEAIPAKISSEYNITRIEIIISNNKKIIIKCDESLSFMKITIA